MKTVLTRSQETRLYMESKHVQLMMLYIRNGSVSINVFLGMKHYHFFSNVYVVCQL